MKKRILCVLLAVMLTVSLLPAAGAQDGVEYLRVDISGDIPVAVPETCYEYTEVDENTTVWEEGWYVVNRDVEIDERISVTSHASLILCDGVTLNAKKGIAVSISGDSLSIYAQSEGDEKGTLIAQGGADGQAGISCGYDKYFITEINIYGGNILATGAGSAAGIGGNDNVGGMVTIFGGDITARGGKSAAGIGGGSYGEKNSIHIFGGSVKSYGGDYGAAGIGGGKGGAAVISIRGGTVYAESISGGAAIGSGERVSYSQDCRSDVVIFDGTVTAAAKDGAGIGGGYGSDECNVDIRGGTVSASSRYGAGVGGGGEGKVETISIEDGDVTASSRYGAGIGYGENGEVSEGSIMSRITINGGTIRASSEKGYAGIGVGTDSMNCRIKITGGRITATCNGGAGIDCGAVHGVGIIPGSLRIGGGDITAKGSTSAVGEDITDIDNMAVFAGDDEAHAVRVAADDYIKDHSMKYARITAPLTVSYIDYDENGARMAESATRTDCIAVVDGMSVMQEGWFAVRADTALSGLLTVTGDTHLILCDGAELACPAGIELAQGASLALYAQSTDPETAGKLTCKSGGIVCEGSSALTINGGVISAQGNMYGAGIGGGDVAKACGTIVINDGFITANGGLGGTGIGGQSADITVNGGTVTADGYYGAGIGGSDACVTINGGNVTAQGRDGSAGIGSTGASYQQSSVTINGGTVRGIAIGDGAGIGGGDYCYGCYVEISGGEVYGESSGDGAGIGGGARDGKSAVTVSGGTVHGTAKGGGAGVGSGSKGESVTVSVSGGTVSGLAKGAPYGEPIGAGYDAREATVEIDETADYAVYAGADEESAVPFEQYAGTPKYMRIDFLVPENTASLSLDGIIGVNFYLDLDAYRGVEAVGISSPHPTSESGERIINLFDDFDARKTDGKYKFTVETAAAQMTEPINVRIFGEDGILYEKTVTVREMLETYIEYYSAYPVITDLCEAMLTYGGKSQVYFAYRTDSLADVNYGADISGVTAEDVEGFDTVFTDADKGDNFAYAAQTFSCRSSTVMRYAFTVDKGYTAADFTAEFTEGGDGLALEITDKGNQVVVSVTGIPAAYLDNYFTFVVKCGGEEMGAVSSCAMCYAKLVLNSASTSDELKELVKSIYVYNKAANTYFGK